MSTSATRLDSVVPARLSYLAIYNPSLGRHEDTLHDQIVFYYSRKTKFRQRSQGRRSKDEDVEEQKNERLRQVGLAQGTVQFAKSFSDGESVNFVDTEKSRIILHELEPGWWLLASVDLTQLPVQDSKSKGPSKKQESEASGAVEYSAREVAPSWFLLQQLLKAHNVFLLHHARSLEDLWNRTTRLKFCNALERYWASFARRWDVLLHGNPATEMLGAVKLAVGGELGIGVGEEEWGSGEREVLEGFIDRTDGLVDMVVSRFGSQPVPEKKGSESVDDMKRSWAGSGKLVDPADGIIFTGVGAISKTSLTALSTWIELLYIRGEEAYGVHDNPNSIQRPKQISKASDENKGPNQSKASELEPRIPPSILIPASDSKTSQKPKGKATAPVKEGANDKSQDPGMLLKYLTLGYGSSWSLSAQQHQQESQKETDPNTAKVPKKPDASGSDQEAVPPNADMKELEDEQEIIQNVPKSNGYFLVGLVGDLERDENIDADQETSARTLPRTLHVKLDESNQSSSKEHPTKDTEQSFAGSTNSRASRAVESGHHDIYRKLRVVVYMYQPFIFIFLFDLSSPNLALPAFYRSLHHQLGPLQIPLLGSTDPRKATQRIKNAKLEGSSTSSKPIYDLIYDPDLCTVHSTIPNIPSHDSFEYKSSEPSSPWTRLEALNVHVQILNTFQATRRRFTELERTSKTSRGWWVVWTRLPSNEMASYDDSDQQQYREAFLIRKASEVNPKPSRFSTSGLRGLQSSSKDYASWTPSKLAEGIGVDTRKYVEGLLNLNR